MMAVSISGFAITFLLLQFLSIANSQLSPLEESREYSDDILNLNSLATGNSDESFDPASMRAINIPPPIPWPKEQCTLPPPWQRDEKQLPNSPIQTTKRCGEIYGCPTGGIFYKPFEALLPNERCIWTIFVADSTGYEVTIRHFGYVPTGQNQDGIGLIISEFGGRQRPTHFIPTNSSTHTILSSTPLIVTFFTGPETTGQSGFILEYKALYGKTESHLVSAQSRHFLIGTEEYYHRYPASGGYRPNELSSLVFLPKDNIFREEKDNVIVYTHIGGISSCSGGFLNVYILNVTCLGPNNWEFKGRICGSDHETGLLRSSEPILLIFESSYYEREADGKGFKFTYSTSL